MGALWRVRETRLASLPNPKRPWRRLTEGARIKAQNNADYVFLGGTTATVAGLWPQVQRALVMSGIQSP